MGNLMANIRYYQEFLDSYNSGKDKPAESKLLFYMNDGSILMGNVFLFKLEDTEEIPEQTESVEELHKVFMEGIYKNTSKLYTNYLESKGSVDVKDKEGTILLTDVVMKTSRGVIHKLGGLVVNIDNISSFTLMDEAQFIELYEQL